MSFFFLCENRDSFVRLLHCSNTNLKHLRIRSLASKPDKRCRKHVNQMDWRSWANPSPVPAVRSAPSFECQNIYHLLWKRILHHAGNKSRNMSVAFAGRRNVIYVFLRNGSKQNSFPVGCFFSTCNIFHWERCDEFLSEVVHVANQAKWNFSGKSSVFSICPIQR